MFVPQSSSVLVTLSLVVNAPATDPWPKDGIDDVLEAFLDGVSDRLLAFDAQLAKEPWHEGCYGITFHYLTGDPDFVAENAGRCLRCGRWTTDVNLPNKLDLICAGSKVSGKLVCGECQHLGELSWPE